MTSCAVCTERAFVTGRRQAPEIPDAARQVSDAGRALPVWCDRYLAAPDVDFFASRAWFDAVLGHAVPPTARVEALAPGGAVLLPLLRDRGRLSSLTTPYTLTWRPLAAGAVRDVEARAAGAALGEHLRFQPPLRLEALDPAAPLLPALRDGLRKAGIAVLEHAQFGNWHEALPVGTTWDGYLATRAPALRTTVRRKLARAARAACFEHVDGPGPALEAGIAAYTAVRARSWKPYEPFPEFDAALMHAAAMHGLLRLGVLRDAGDGAPVAAQYWILSGGHAHLLKLAHDKDQRAASPGTVLTALMVRRLLERDRVSGLDLGRGDDPYKALWVAGRRQRVGLVLASPLHPAGLAEIARHAAGRLRRQVAGRLR